MPTNICQLHGITADVFDWPLDVNRLFHEMPDLRLVAFIQIATARSRDVAMVTDLWYMSAKIGIPHLHLLLV